MKTPAALGFGALALLTTEIALAQAGNMMNGGAGGAGWMGGYGGPWTPILVIVVVIALVALFFKRGGK
jgi:uncharacterized membrane protein